MTFLGIDPGTRRIGYGLVRKENGSLTYLAAGILDVRSGEDNEALRETKRELDALIQKWRPDVLAVERLFFAKNAKTAIGVAQARGVVLLSAAERGLSVREYGPSEIKMGLTGYGSADKKAVLKMLRLILNKPSLDLIDDASDALGMAVFACQDRALSG